MRSSKPLLTRLLAIFTAALLGYLWGWMWSWSLADPNLDFWALGAGLGALIGLGAGLLGLYQRQAITWLAATFGLFLGWDVRTLVFGDIPGGWGLLVMLVGAAAGVLLVRRAGLAQSAHALRILLVALYAGFLGGFLIEQILFDLILGLVKTHSILGQSMWIILCAAVAGGLAFRWTLGQSEYPIKTAGDASL